LTKNAIIAIFVPAKNNFLSLFNSVQNQKQYHMQLIKFLSCFSDGFTARQRDRVKHWKGDPYDPK
jgi:hypothetical protein